jgi:3-hydroxybutyryl-CoA dehydratase
MIETYLKIGERAEFSKTIGETDLVLFSGLTGDFDPIHVNEHYARATAFGRRIAHGGLVMGLLSATASMISRRSVERGAKAVPVSLGYDKIRFIAPVFINDTITARYTIEERCHRRAQPLQSRGGEIRGRGVLGRHPCDEVGLAEITACRDFDLLVLVNLIFPSLNRCATCLLLMLWTAHPPARKCHGRWSPRG